MTSTSIHRATLWIAPGHVKLQTGHGETTALHRGRTDGIRNALEDLRRSRTRHLRIGRHDDDERRTVSELLRTTAGLLAEEFLPAAPASALTGAIDRAEAEGAPLRLGLMLADDLVAAGWSRFPWEAMPEPRSGIPLGLHRSVHFYRRSRAPAARLRPGPLRILVAIASPLRGGGPLLDYERELRTVVEAVRQAQRHDVVVEEVRFATVDAIATALRARPPHVLHLHAHGSPGLLHLENDFGDAVAVTPSVFLRACGRALPPIISLASCQGDVFSEPFGSSFAGALSAGGVSAVLATQGTISDRYAAHFFAEVYGELARASDPDVLAAAAVARRSVQDALQGATNPVDRFVAELDEWSVVSLLCSDPGVEAASGESPAATTAPTRPHRSDRMDTTGAASASGRRAILSELADEAFVGRRWELRTMPHILTGESLPGTVPSGTEAARAVSAGADDVPFSSGILLYGLGGLGKSALAAALVEQAEKLRPELTTVIVSGRTDPTTVLATIVAAWRARRQSPPSGTSADTGDDGRFAAFADPGQPWRDRWQALGRFTAAQAPTLLVFDQFDVNLRLAPPERETAGTAPTPIWQIADPALAEAIASALDEPGGLRILLTARHPFVLPRTVRDRLRVQQVQPLTHAETLKLVWSLPALSRLDDEQLHHLWQTIGGHPRAMLQLDAILQQDTRTGSPQADRLDDGLVKAAALVATDVGLTEMVARLSAVPGAWQLLLGASVHRNPVRADALYWCLDDPESSDDRWVAVLAPLVHSGLLSWDVRMVAGVRADQVIVLRCLATELHRLSRLRHGEAELVDAHRRAARYWRAPESVPDGDDEARIDAMLESAYHEWHAGDEKSAAELTVAATYLLLQRERADRVVVTAKQLYDQLAPGVPLRAELAQHMGIAYHLLGDKQRAAFWYMQSNAEAQPSASSSLLAANSSLGTLLVQEYGDVDEAERRFREQLDAYVALGEVRMAATTRHQLAAIAAARGNLAEARAGFQQARDEFREIGQEDGAIRAEHSLGLLDLEEGALDSARDRFRRTLRFAERSGRKLDVGIAELNLGAVDLLQGRYAACERHLTAALDIADRSDDLAGIAAAQAQLGALAEARNDLTEADRRFGLAIRYFRRLGDVPGEIGAELGRGMVAVLRGQPAEARTHLERALQLAEQLHDVSATAHCLGALGRLALDEGDLPRADRYLAPAAAHDGPLVDPVVSSLIGTGLGLLRARQGRDVEALRHQIVALCKRIDRDEPARENAEELYDIRVRLGRHRFAEEAARLLDETSLANLTAMLDARPPAADTD
ncbi:tetratricopeptide repeat protein [Micromonospora haikouensis]|uniref:tetratricopeptide repeat protein n=1 Tax=Micromonospora haikouensis TaxID=686309 RepID=UPI003D718B0E